MLARLPTTLFEPSEDDHAYFIDRDPKLFRIIMEFIRSGYLKEVDSDIVDELIEEAKYYLLDEMVDCLNQFNNNDQSKSIGEILYENTGPINTEVEQIKNEIEKVSKELIDLLLLSEKDEIDMIVDNNRIIIENLVIYVEMNLTNLSFCIIEAFSYFGITLNYNYENKKFLICKGAIPSSPTYIPNILQRSVGLQIILFDDKSGGKYQYLNLHQIFYLIKKHYAINFIIICSQSYVEDIKFCNVGKMWELKKAYRDKLNGQQNLIHLQTSISNFIISECLKHDFHYHMQVEDALNKLNSQPYKRYIHVLSR